MPAPGNHTSKLSKSSSLDPGPPCNNRTFRSGFVPTRFVHTLNVPLGVSIGTIRDPPDTASWRSQEVVSKYEAAGWSTDGAYSSALVDNDEHRRQADVS